MTRPVGDFLQQERALAHAALNGDVDVLIRAAEMIDAVMKKARDNQPTGTPAR